MVDWRLTLRLMRGAGRGEIIRLIVLAAGIACVVVAVLLGFAAPRVSASAQLVAHARAAVHADPEGTASSSRLHVRVSDLVVDGKRWTRFVVSGVDDSAPLPPGVSAWPVPGKSVVSEAVARLAADDVGARALAPEPVAEHVSAEGLASPDELVSWTVARTDVGGSAVVAFGIPGSSTASAPLGLQAAELVLLVLCPAILFLSTLQRAAVTARRPRLRALALAGASPSRCVRLFVREMTVVCVVGASAGALLYAWGQATLGRSGLLGLRWSGSQAGLPAWAGVLVVAFVVVLVRRISRRAMSRELAGSRAATPDARIRRWPITYVLVPAVACLAWTCVRAATGGVLPDSGIIVAMFATGMATGALVLAAPALVVSVARGVGALVARRRAPTPGVRLGARRAEVSAVATGRLAAAVGVLVVVIGFSTGMLGGLQKQAFGTGTTTGLDILLEDTSSAGRAALASLPVSLVGVRATLDGRPVTLTVGTCDALVHARMVSSATCRETPQVGWGVPPGGTVEVPLGDGTTKALPGPTQAAADASWDVKVPPGSAPWILDAPTGSVTLSVPNGQETKVAASLLEVDPGLAVTVGDGDDSLQAPYDEQVGLLRASLTVGSGLALGAFLVAALELWWSGRRSAAALHALGASRRVLGVAASTQLVLPVVAMGAAAAVVGTLAGWAIAAGWPDGFDASVPAATAIPVVVAAVVTVVVGWAASRRPPPRSALADM